MLAFVAAAVVPDVGTVDVVGTVVFPFVVVSGGVVTGVLLVRGALVKGLLVRGGKTEVRGAVVTLGGSVFGACDVVTCDVGGSCATVMLFPFHFGVP